MVTNWNNLEARFNIQKAIENDIDIDIVLF